MKHVVLLINLEVKCRLFAFQFCFYSGFFTWKTLIHCHAPFQILLLQIYYFYSFINSFKWLIFFFFYSFRAVFTWCRTLYNLKFNRFIVISLKVTPVCLFTRDEFHSKKLLSRFLEHIKFTHQNLDFNLFIVTFLSGYNVLEKIGGNHMTPTRWAL